MLQANMALARRIERAECRLVVDMARSVARRRGQDEVLIAELAGGAAVYAGPGSPLNKWIGLGFGAPLDESRLAELELDFARRDTAPRVELSAFADPSIAPMLERHGFRLVGHENVLALELDGPLVERVRGEQREIGDDISITRVAPEASRLWLDIVITGFMHPDGSSATPATETFEREALERAFADTIEVQDFDMHLAQRAGVAAGGGGLRRFEGVAQLCGASTLPAHRRHGVQTALLCARLLAAAQSGCDLAIVTTEPDSKSQRNVEARGFKPLYARSILVQS
ncbi:MAG: GNAT family N-acetyltransferase [Planctomycetota bacterium]